MPALGSRRNTVANAGDSRRLLDDNVIELSRVRGGPKTASVSAAAPLTRKAAARRSATRRTPPSSQLRLTKKTTPGRSLNGLDLVIPYVPTEHIATSKRQSTETRRP